MPYVFIVILFCSVVSLSFAKTTYGFPVGDYSLHFNQAGEVIKPDEYYVYKAAHDNEDGFKDSAIKNFQKAASYGNTFAVYYTGLLYLQKDDFVNGYAWLSMVETKGFPHADNTLDLLHKLKNQLKPAELEAAMTLQQDLEAVYGAKPAFDRRLAWSRNFKLTGTSIKGHVPNRLKIQTDLSHDKNIIVNGTANAMGANVNGVHIRKALKSFVYEYELDYRISHGEVKLGDFKVIETDD